MYKGWIDIISHNYKRYENESEEELILRIGNDKDKIGTWSDVAEIINSLTNQDYGVYRV